MKKLPTKQQNFGSFSFNKDSSKKSSASQSKVILMITTLLVFMLSIGIVIKDNELKASPLNIPKSKTTPLEKYLTSTQAYELLEKNPNVLFIDVRDPIEVSQTGHPNSIDAIVPVKVQTSKIDKNLNEYSLVENPSFVIKMEELIAQHNKSRHDMIIITCGSGQRSALAVHKLAYAGYTNVWHIADGYPGDEKPGLNAQNAWQLAGLPWSKELVAGSQWIKLID